MKFGFQKLQGDATGPRLGSLQTPSGVVATPAFMGVATRGMLRGIPPDRPRRMGAQILLCNALHLWSRPGTDAVRALGGVHGMLAWDGPILTDSGGFQAFSLSKLARVDQDGIHLPHPVSGRAVHWTPALAFQSQQELAPDIAMLLDHCPEDPLDAPLVQAAVQRTLAWAQIQADLHQARGGVSSGQAQFGIVQGGLFPEQRKACAEGLVQMEFDGYAIGGVSVGEPHDQMMRAVEFAVPHLPSEKVRYLMGVGTPLDLIEAVARGVDLFDCVFPTRSGRFATALTWQGRLHLLNARFREDKSPIEENCSCTACRCGVSRGALRAGFQAKELNPPSLVAEHNLHFTLQLMAKIRSALQNGSFNDLRKRVAAIYPGRGANSDAK